MYQACSFQVVLGVVGKTTRISIAMMQEVPRGIQNNASVFVVSHHRWLLSKCTVAQAIIKLYFASATSPDRATAELSALKQALGIKRLVWPSD